MIFEEQYRPSKAARKESHGVFDVYYFANGASLTLRRQHADALFSKGRLTYSPIHIADGEAAKVLDAYAAKDTLFLVRTEKRKHFASTYDRLLNCYGKIYAARARMETPVAWLNEPLQTHHGAIIVTKYRADWAPLQQKVLQIRDPNESETPTQAQQDCLRSIFEKVFYELGKMHGAGVRHGHPHFNNILVDKSDNVAFTDPKLLGSVKDHPTIMSYSGVEVERFPHQGDGGEFDLKWLTHQINKYKLRRVLDWHALVAAYKKGVALGKKRTAHLQ